MIKVFRKIRQKLIEEKKIGNYLKYAIGEILLVVIGILIALQINNWNELRKQKHSMHTSLLALLEDYKQDTTQLNADIREINSDMAFLDNFRERLSGPSATIDSVKYIARYEYVPFFNPSNELNRNTIISLLSTGSLDYFDEVLKKEILKHNSEQINLIKIMDENIQIFLTVVTNTGIIPQGEHPSISNSTIKGPLMDIHWNKMDNVDLLNRMLITISHKKMMYFIIGNHKEKLLNETLKMINLLNSYKKTND